MIAVDLSSKPAAIDVEYSRYTAVTNAVISAMAKLREVLAVISVVVSDNPAYCRPMHILPPLEKAQNHLFITATCSAGPNHRSGSNLRGSGNTSALRWSEYGDMLTIVPAGTG